MSACTNVSNFMLNMKSRRSTAKQSWALFQLFRVNVYVCNVIIRMNTSGTIFYLNNKYLLFAKNYFFYIFE